MRKYLTLVVAILFAASVTAYGCKKAGVKEEPTIGEGQAVEEVTETDVEEIVPAEKAMPEEGEESK